ncbi:MAG: bifunctional oligoribonuclease/PAP phosphatase NrnA [Firmicutes bacterium]|nr:bifunctional oligoribonuclease/PAP phosphatase NrnA [Bacillota bacterium]
MDVITITRNIYKDIYKKIKEYDTIVVLRHVSPDPDAIASQIALRDSIKLTFPKKKVYALGASVSRFKKYGLMDKVNYDELKNSLVVALDVPNLFRVDGLEYIEYKEMIKIDHHPFEDKFGEIEYVDPDASSACELLAKVIFNSKLKIDKNIANNLFLGIVSDSDRFLVDSTTKETFKIVYKLIDEVDIDFTSLYPILYERPINEIKFHGYIANNLTITENGLAYMKFDADIFNEYGVDPSTPSNMINDFNNIKDIYSWVFITTDEKNDQYKVNIRSRGPIINEIASKYNGGGHKFASGARPKTMESVDNLIKDLDEACKNYKDNL